MQTFILSCQFHVFVWSLLRFLDKSMQQDHLALHTDVEKDTPDAATRKVRPHLVKPILERTAGWHSDRPAELDRLNVQSNSLSILDGLKRFEPLSNRLSTGRRAKKDGAEALHRTCGCSPHTPNVPHKVHLSSENAKKHQAISDDLIFASASKNTPAAAPRQHHPPRTPRRKRRALPTYPHPIHPAGSYKAPAHFPTN